jgi:hypothetical protein
MSHNSKQKKFNKNAVPEGNCKTCKNRRVIGINRVKCPDCTGFKPRSAQIPPEEQTTGEKLWQLYKPKPNSE